MYPRELEAMPIVLPGEGRLLELISTDLPFKDVLNDICAALDVQLGNAVSVVLSAEDDEHVLHRLAEQAVQFGLYVFSCCAILSQSDQLLGTLETYSCLSRRPAVSQTSLIQRASQLAALAMQRHDREHDPWITVPERRAPEGHLPEN